jgi:hypothetical protein
VLRPELPRGAARPAEHHRQLELPARHQPDLGRVVDDLIDRHQREVPRHQLDDGPQAHHGRPDADADEAALGDGRVDDALLAELLQHPLRHLVGALVVADLFAHEEDGRVALHLLGHRLVERFAIAQPRHHIFLGSVFGSA